MDVVPWQSYAYYDETNLRMECTCPNCKVVWQHHHDKMWVREHFGYAVGPVTCPECGTPSVAGSAKRYKPRKIYVESALTPEPVFTRSGRRRGWFGRAREQKGAADDYEYQR